MNPIPSTTPYHHGDLARACVEAALDLLRDRGIAGVTLRDVASAIGVSRSAPYRHFADKQSLLAACAMQGFESLTAEVNRILTASEPLSMATIRALLTGYAEIGHADPHLYRLMFAYYLPAEKFPVLEAQAKMSFDLLYRGIEQGQAAGTLAAGDTYGRVLLLWAAIHGLVSLCNDLSPNQTLDTEALPVHVERILDTLAPLLDPELASSR
ncbi:MAG: TetR/AcrR family transcriptional regulator [Salinisphaera sp.]|jgi:AcrR family transcriptional regulator|nr:TetR/AcrR family transcriptional regulator [Salinisphaera sp.]